MAAADEANGITLQEAQGLIEAALTWAAERGYRMAVAVVDVGGHPVAMGRMDGASILACEVVIQKARAAAWLNRPTTDAVDRGKEWPHVYTSFAVAAQGSLTLSKGAFPIARGNRTLGAIGAAGGTADQDAGCSLAALDALAFVADPSHWRWRPGSDTAATGSPGSRREPIS
jgi:uncharacterized protein GlcG (DUF336 family)